MDDDGLGDWVPLHFGTIGLTFCPYTQEKIPIGNVIHVEQCDDMSCELHFGVSRGRAERQPDNPRLYRK